MASGKQRKETDLRPFIIDEFIKVFLEEGAYPGSVYKFSQDIGIKEEDFYRFFGSFKGIEKAIWQDLMVQTIESIHGDQAYQSFNIREKLLSFYYTHLEVLLRHRSFILQNFDRSEKSIKEPYFLQNYKKTFNDFARELIDQGLETGEIANRKYISDHYQHGFWIQLLFILKFWTEDDSPAFEKTDAAVEKAVNLSFELIGKGPLESMVDFAKFVFQNR